MFKSLSELGINTLEDFRDSPFSDMDKALNINFARLQVASSEKEEQVQVLFYFIEGNGKLIKDDETFFVYLLDDIRFVLLDDCTNFYIIIRDNDAEEACLMFE